ncbi:type II toxin-antitoxin system RelE family toxin [Nocardioides kongjuensis]|uniref:mRNA-degrading endonuclease RelE of RelBE toxin-antitoxin system n=1 Tax=Nocardioides kongjuensis TaxID=349522 RepID=A0A852RGS5_9ACTN|nr:hypothetical protein [Nocardioides kongjuensis]NYD32761.1 mRNA-degrading endonuclease RelE of RelBE toxin-antitoxin system [Nocardioides kongjuensis]
MTGLVLGIALLVVAVAVVLQRPTAAVLMSDAVRGAGPSFESGACPSSTSKRSDVRQEATAMFVERGRDAGYTTYLTADATESLRAMNHEDGRVICAFIFGDLALAPQRHGARVLSASDPAWQTACGGYRIVYVISAVERTVHVLEIA